MKTRHVFKKLCLTAGLLLFSTSFSAAASVYSITELGTLGGQSSYGYGVNNSGQVVGYSYNQNGENRAFLFENGEMKDLGTLGGNRSRANGINNHGEIVGSAETSNGETHAYRYKNNTMTDLGVLSGTTSSANAINDNGTVVGTSRINNGASNQAFIQQEGGAIQGIQISNSISSSANDINNQGQITGQTYSNPGGSQAYLYENGATNKLGKMGGDDSSGSGINNNGDIVGEVTTIVFDPDLDMEDYVPEGFLYSENNLTLLGDLGANSSNAYAISDDGKIVGRSQLPNASGTAIIYQNGEMTDLSTLIDPNDPLYGQFILNFAFDISDNGKFITGYGFLNGKATAFLLEDLSVTAVPLPAAFPLYGAGMLVIGFLARRKKVKLT